MEQNMSENDSVDLGNGKGTVEEARKRSLTPLQNISNNASSEEIGHHNGDDDAPPAKRAREEATDEDISPKETATVEKNLNDEKAEGNELVTLLAADGIIGVSPDPSMSLSVVCTYDEKPGYLFPLEDGFFFLHKYSTHIAFSHKQEVGGEEKDSGNVGGEKDPKEKESMELGADVGSDMKDEEMMIQGCERAEES
uniref:Uncharacterized protein n=1 Tax=Parascaris equorum TaxID=6256 RepID=A0A914RE33_PAREQ